MKKQYRVDITASAESDTSEIWNYIAQDNPNAATTFVLRLEEQINSLEQYPERCPLIPENEFLGTTYRHLLFGNYRTIFRIINNCVIIMRIIHGARLLDSRMLEGS